MLCVLDQIQMFFLINTKNSQKQEISWILHVVLAQLLEFVLPMAFLAKSGGFGVEYTWKREKYLKSLTAIRLKRIGLISGKQ